MNILIILLLIANIAVTIYFNLYKKTVLEKKILEENKKTEAEEMLNKKKVDAARKAMENMLNFNNRKKKYNRGDE